MSVSPCALSVPLLLGVVVGVIVHPVAGIVLGIAVLAWNVVRARRSQECTTCAWPRRPQ
ncbi:hypothetical protein [Raineyella sp. LH-20]|uniref:hypothetical protein n=1 Tax=Raineyella sp. LH-20 TaxID=3081204 RepID=UPI002953285C|nr:hypothetical protein [Raineyella sp. LH-20]WOP19184.1 hypothetical protein R0146_02645 [Raineyella sp. LH-20]